MKNISPAYQASDYEDKIYKKWEKSGAFTPKIDKKKKPFTISMPPPNATGTLHLGHAAFLTIEDIIIRYKRMQGFSALWLPGTDHASIATQNKVEKIIAEEGKTRHDLGRKAFLERVDKYVSNSQDIIRNQIRKMGSSCDWTRERYTLDKGLNNAVREAFIKMYNDGVIYRGYRIVNWCTRCGSTLADDEVEYKMQKSKFYYFKYGPVIIGTARPETKFLDKVIVVHPDDKRYKKYIGKEIELEWIEGKVKARFLADESADPKFGTGAMTITPAHSFVDFELAKKHNLEIVQIIDEKGNLTSVTGEFKGRNAYEAREDIVKKLAKKGLVEKIDNNYEHNLSVCYRCETPIEPLISRQWFIDVNKKSIQEGKVKKSIKEKAIEVVRDGQIKIIPDRFDKIYFHWMENLRDWCISRQIWFGHRIPAWYCKDPNCPRSKDAIVPKKGEPNPEKCPNCKNKIKQDSDTLDTWFSAGLWTFSTLGWPENTEDFKYFHPTSVLETGYDILFFWIARMIIMTTYNLGEVPFEKVYLHGLVRDKLGRKMSKSLGNGIDPLEMIEKYGADALRLSLTVGATPGNDIRLYEEKIAGSRNFVNKIWNASRFVLMNMDEKDFSSKIDIKTLNSSDKWILSQLQELIKETTKGLDEYSFSDVGSKIYDFVWSQFCDWYLEMSKVQTNKPVLIYILKNLLLLLHPFVPYVSEAIWENFSEKSLLISASWPKVDPKFIFKKEEKEMNLIKEVITSIRSIRSEYKVEAGKKIEAIIYSEKLGKLFKEKEEIIKRLASLKNLVLQKVKTPIKKAVSKFFAGTSLFLPLESLVDLNQEKLRMEKEILNLENMINGLESKLDNQGFVKNAPKEVVRREEEKLKDFRDNLKKLEERLKNL